MNILNKIFGSKKKAVLNSPATQEYIDSIQNDTSTLWKFLEETMVFYNLESCQCAFPRYRQIASINMTDLEGSFYVSETEGFIEKSHPYFTIQKVDIGNEISNAIWTCKKCGSEYEFGWSDFSIYVKRCFLKMKKLKTVDIGSEIINPIPVFVGPIGHSYPSNIFKKVSFEEFKEYVRANKNGH